MGVIKVAASVAIPVKLTESARFAFAKALIKLEILPPGHEAIRIIPNATVGVGFNKITKRKVTAGNKKNWEITPTITDFGRMINPLNSRHLMSRATPNIIKAIVIFNANKPDGEKFNLTWSRISKASFI